MIEENKEEKQKGFYLFGKQAFPQRLKTVTMTPQNKANIRDGGKTIHDVFKGSLTRDFQRKVFS
jgi:hypothetical protein